MKGLHFIKIIFALTIIVTAKEITEFYSGENSIINIGLFLIFWLVLLIFMDFRDWVTRPFPESSTEEKNGS